MTEQGLTTIIHKDRHGKHINERVLSVPITSELGSSETLAMSQKGVTENLGRIDATFAEQSEIIAQMQMDIDSIISGSASASLTANKTVVYKGVPTAITFTAKCTPEADEIRILRGTEVKQTGSGASLQVTVEENTQADVTYKAVFIVSGNPREVELRIKAVRPIYYGAGTTESDAVTETPARTSPAGTYTIHVPHDNMWIYFVIPEGMTIRSSSEGPIEFPLSGPSGTTREVAGAVVNYLVYQSNELEAGDYTITLT